MKKVTAMMCATALGAAMAAFAPAMHAQATSADKSFLKDAGEGGLAEVQMGQLAEQKGASPDVKAFGHKMVVDHTKLNDEMKPEFGRLGVSVPSSPSVAQKAKYEELKMKSGADFDKAYIKAMVNDHQEDLNDFSKEASTTKDGQLKAKVEKGKMVIAEHKRMIDEIAKKHGVS